MKAIKKTSKNLIKILYTFLLLLGLMSMQNTLSAQPTSCIGGGSITVELVCMEMLVGESQY